MTRVVIVTGSSRGIGAAIAKRLAKDGYAVCVNYRSNKQAADAVVKAISAAGGKAIAVQADVGDEAGVAQLFNITCTALGAITALVNCAGIQPKAAAVAVAELPLAVLADVYRTNVFGTMLCCREAMKHIQPGGAMVTISSEAARFGGNQMCAYASSKAAVNTFTIGFAREAAKAGIRVNAVSPGVIDTEIHRDATPERLQALRQSIPLGRMGTADEVAAVVAWLLSDESSYVSGAIVPVAGGR